MALDENKFTAMAEHFYYEEMRAAYPEVIKSRNVDRVANEDGTTDLEITNEVGPLDLDPIKLRPLFRAIGKAVTEFIKEHAETASGRIW